MNLNINLNAYNEVQPERGKHYLLWVSGHYYGTYYNNDGVVYNASIGSTHSTVMNYAQHDDAYWCYDDELDFSA